MTYDSMVTIKDNLICSKKLLNKVWATRCNSRSNSANRATLMSSVWLLPSIECKRIENL
jgi:hypothetical protein